MKEFDLKKYIAEGKLLKENSENEIASRVRKIGKKEDIADKDIEEYVGELSGNFEPDAYENTTDDELLKDLKSYIAGSLEENDDQPVLYPFESGVDLMSHLLNGNASLIDDIELKELNSIFAEEEENYPDAEFLTPKRMRDIVKDLIKDGYSSR